MPKKPVKKIGDPLIGAIIDRRWQIVDQLGTGGMGVVYRAERVGLGKQVAIKFLHQSIAESKAAVARFDREAKAISRLHHMHCISILDFGVYRKQPYIVMEFVQGRQLTELDMATVTPNRAVAMMRQILLGLAHAHSRGVIHRDLKLSNVMLVEMTGTEDLVKILDFGLARLEGGAAEEASLTDGLIAGTPSYMSPEQALGKKTDLRTDIYSAGVMLFVLATGKRPFVADNATALLRMQVQDAPPSPRKIAGGKRISEPLERVILRALEKKPADRFQSANEFVAALDETPEGQETLTPTVARERPTRRRWQLMVAAAVACVALGAFGALRVRAYFLRLRSQAVGAYEHWTAPPEQKPVPPPSGPPTGVELPDPPKPAAPPPQPTTPQQQPTTPPTGETVAPEPTKAAEPEAKPREPEPKPPEPAPAPTTTPPPHASAAREPPPPRDVREWRDQIDRAIADAKYNTVKNQLRDRIAVDKRDGWSHLRLGDVYADGFHFRRDAFREWSSALALQPSLATDAAFRKSVCEAVDANDHAAAQEFLRAHFDADGTASLLSACVRAATDAARIDRTAQLLEAVDGSERPELGAAALRMLDVGKTCAQKKIAVEMIGRLHYLRARGTLVKLDRQRLAHAKNPPPTLACFGSSIADAIEQLK